MLLRFLATIAAVLATVAAPAEAHEFWLEPQSFHRDAPGSLPVGIRTGDGADVENWPVKRQRNVSLRSIGIGGVVDQQASATDGIPGVTLSLRDAGPHILALETNHAFIELPANEFNAYIQHEGLTPIAADRTKLQAFDRPGREMYSRRAKALVRVGEGEDEIFTRPIGMSLEIIPERCPYHLEREEKLPVRVQHHGRPLAGATLTLVRIDRPATPAVTAVADKDGRALFSFPREGKWMVAVVWSEPLEDRIRADYDTTFSSLTFGFDPS